MPKISALTSLAQASVDTAADVLPIVDATAPATTKKVTVQAMVNAGLAAAAPQGGIFALTGALTVSGQSSFAAGTAAAPSVKVGAEQNGLYSSAANTLDVTLNGVRQAQFSYTAAAVNYLKIAGAPTGGALWLDARGSDANVSILYSTRGSGSHVFASGNSATNQFVIAHVANAVNYWQFFGAAAAGALNMYADGADTNIAVVQNTKGTGSHFFRTNGGAQTQLEVVHVASAVNRLQIGGAATAGSPYLTAAGSDTNINIYYGAKGSGCHAFASGAGLIQFQVNHVASAVNQWIVQGGATGQSPFFFAAGSDTNVSAGFSLKGAGNFSFYTGTTTATQLIITHTASTVNAMTLTGSTTGQPTRIGNYGSDANPDILIAPQGTGVLRFGTHSALAAETVTGYITIKDAAGNSRKLAVVS